MYIYITPNPGGRFHSRCGCNARCGCTWPAPASSALSTAGIPTPYTIKLTPPTPSTAGNPTPYAINLTPCAPQCLWSRGRGRETYRQREARERHGERETERQREREARKRHQVTRPFPSTPPYTGYIGVSDREQGVMRMHMARSCVIRAFNRRNSHPLYRV